MEAQAVILFDTAGCIVDANARAGELYGCSRDELIGRCGRDMSPRSRRIWPGRDPAERGRLLAEVRRTGVSVYYVLVDGTGTHEPEAVVFEAAGVRKL